MCFTTVFNGVGAARRGRAGESRARPQDRRRPVCCPDSETGSETRGDAAEVRGRKALPFPSVSVSVSGRVCPGSRPPERGLPPRADACCCAAQPRGEAGGRARPAGPQAAPPPPHFPPLDVRARARPVAHLVTEGPPGHRRVLARGRPPVRSAQQLLLGHLSCSWVIGGHGLRDRGALGVWDGTAEAGEPSRHVRPCPPEGASLPEAASGRSATRLLWEEAEPGPARVPCASGSRAGRGRHVHCVRGGSPEDAADQGPSWAPA